MSTGGRFVTTEMRADYETGSGEWSVVFAVQIWCRRGVRPREYTGTPEGRGATQGGLRGQPNTNQATFVPMGALPVK